ncbi:hypothetical protein ASG31_06175 [Chryseobacterium sp. Leaf404]|uniref:hypothetical protein n=1 Tax=unclassified Chryseobacterium TaxID=2593645 RepID=UPI0006F5A31F|nr:MULTISPECIES: hypothetical protein [unclassified Chryseobacterium]KQT18311.1 hypothetical protein ASG31_06175 [Chryseobacterium sp. Leaf404]
MKLFIFFTTFSSALFFSQTAEKPLIIKNDSTAVEKFSFKKPLDSASLKRDLMLVKKPSDSLYLSLVKKKTDTEMIEILTAGKQKDLIVKFDDPKALPKKNH